MFSYQLQERLVDAGIVREFGVESCGHGSSLPDRDWVCTVGGENFDAGADAGNPGGTDEDHFQRRVSELFAERWLQKLALADGAVDLAAVGVAADGDVDGAKAGLGGILDVFRQQNRTGAGSEGRFQADELLEFFETFRAEQFQKGATFPAGNYQAVDMVELLGLFYEHNFGAQFFEPAAVGVEIALQGKDSNHGRWSSVVGSLVVGCWRSRYALSHCLILTDAGSRLVQHLRRGELLRTSAEI